MKLFAAISITLALFGLAFAHTNQAIKITRSGWPNAVTAIGVAREVFEKK